MSKVEEKERLAVGIKSLENIYWGLLVFHKGKLKLKRLV